MNLKDVEPIVKVFTKVAPAHRLFRNFVGGRDHSHVYLEFALAPQSADLGISPISSSNSVPFCATSKHPARRSEAPVNEPFSWPNSSLSMRVSGKAAQLIATNGPWRRALSSWMVRATSSLPVPLSPVIRTQALLGPACCRSAKISCILDEVPT